MEPETETPLPPKLKADETSERLQVVVPKSVARRIDDWRRKQPDIPSKSEAIRILLEKALDD